MGNNIDPQGAGIVGIRNAVRPVTTENRPRMKLRSNASMPAPRVNHLPDSSRD